jgi:diacylglycerol kinase
MAKIHTISFKHAAEGILYSFTSQPNYRVHTILSIIAIFMGIFLHIDRHDWVILILIIVLGLAIEMINTAVESVVDLVTSQWHISAKHAKDVAAGAMLLYAVGAIIVACFIFLPKII